jgi:hypothetical protein
MTTREFDTKWIKKPMRAPFNDCWIWTGVICQGYGQFSTHGIQERAHRASWRRFRGEIPNGLHVLHRCDVPSCINPDHLFLGTQADNNADRDAKGRNVYFQGERHGRSKLTQAQVNQIRSSRDKQQEIAQKFGIKQPQVSKIKNRQRWNSSEE